MTLLEMLPANYQHSDEIKHTQQAMNTEVEKVRAAKNNLLLQLNIDTATWGLALWEKICGLETDTSKSDEFRRERVKSKKRSAGVTTVAMIQNVAESFSNGEVDVLECPEECRFEIKFIGTLGIPPNMDGLTAAIEEIKPAHLNFLYVYVYIAWDRVEAYNHTWDEWDAKSLTWEEFEVYKE